MNITFIEDEVTNPDPKNEKKDFVIKNDSLIACNNRNLEIVTIPDGILTIKENVFEEMTSIKEVILPESIKIICDRVFANCTNLEKINLPSGLIRLQNEVFLECKSLKQITLPQSLTFIGDDCFALSSIESVQIPDSMEYIGEGAFEHTNLKDVFVPKSVKFLGNQTFRSCTNLEKLILEGHDIEIPEAFCEFAVNLKTMDLSNIKSIGNCAFYGCQKLCIDKIPANIKHVGNNAFSRTENIKNLIIEDLSAYRSSVSIFAESNIESVQINVKNAEHESPSPSRQHIPDEMFYRCEKLKNVTFTGDTRKIDSIGKLAFTNTNIMDIDIPQNVTIIRSHAFEDCLKLRRISLPDTLETIEDYAFTYCGLSEIIIPDSVYAIGPYCFRDCKNLNHVQFSKNVSIIPVCCFECCEKLESFETTGKIEEIRSMAFHGCAIKEFDFSSVISIGPRAFSYSAIEHIVFSENLVIINSYSDNYYNNAEGAFNHCSNLVSVDFSKCDKVKQISSEMFDICINLKNIKLNENITAFKHSCFNQTCIKSITFPKNTSFIDGYAFGYLNLKDVIFTKDINPNITLMDSSFHGTTIENLTIPRSLYQKYETSLRETCC